MLGKKLKEQAKETVDKKKLTKKLKEKRVTVLKVIEEKQKYKSFENNDNGWIISKKKKNSWQTLQ